jgi:4-oxalocrotonate tautomerase
MPYVNVQILRGTSREQRKSLVADITRSLVEHLGKRPESIHVVIQEIDEDHWGFAGELTDDWKRRQP